MNPGAWPEASPSTGWRGVYDAMNAPRPGEAIRGVLGVAAGEERRVEGVGAP
jgi:hypothetical protein